MCNFYVCLVTPIGLIGFKSCIRILVKLALWLSVQGDTSARDACQVFPELNDASCACKSLIILTSTIVCLTQFNNQ